VAPSYEFVVSKNIQSVQIDLSLLMADMVPENNHFPEIEVEN
jgi:hypothetical protein